MSEKETPQYRVEQIECPCCAQRLNLLLTHTSVIVAPAPDDSLSLERGMEEHWERRQRGE